MPYPTNADLPSSVRSRLPERAQDVYSEAFSRLRDSCGRATAGGSGASHRLGGGQALACQSRQQLERASVVIFFAPLPPVRNCPKNSRSFLTTAALTGINTGASVNSRISYRGICTLAPSRK
jgi:hypothetical protein